MTYYDWTNADWNAELFGRTIVKADEGDESATLTLDNGTELTIDASLGCCAYGIVMVSDVVGGRVMSVTEETSDPPYDGSDTPDTRYEIFIMKDGFPSRGTITVESYEGTGYYGTGYTLTVRRPEESS